jgi:RNA polymerase sigma factor (sigma-70 family)
MHDPMRSWQQQIEAVRDGSETAYRVMYEQFLPLIRKTLFRFRWYPDREELLQEARIALYQAILDYTPDHGVTFAGFAASRIHYQVWNTVKRNLRHWNRSMQEIAVSEDAEGDTLPDPLLQLACPYANHAYADVEWAECFAILSEREKLAAKKLLMEGLKQGELAAMCGVSVETVKTWRKRALQKLRRELEDGLHK